LIDANKYNQEGVQIEKEDDNHDSLLIEDSSRRVAFQSIFLATSAVPLSAVAGKPELDASGEFFAPKSDMLSGGSDATRGVPLENRKRAKRPKPGESIQTVYETRFIAYLSRFLLNFDPAARTWWVKQGLDDSWEKEPWDSTDDSQEKARELKFSEFTESVEVGLSSYFVGPYGSYASVEAAKAGLIASRPAVSRRPETKDFWTNILPGLKQPPISVAIDEDVSKQGILNLYALLKARYTSRSAKKQLAILFSLISSPVLQPTDEIRGLLGEADNATITKVELVKPPRVANEPESRTSSRRGGGYSVQDLPLVTIETPPALGDDYQEAVLRPIMKPTSRVLKIRVVDGGEGYTDAPAVKVVQSGPFRRCEACAVLDRSGRVQSVLVLDPGFGYGRGKKQIPPKVRIEPPQNLGGQSSRTAQAVADLEYEIVGIEIENGGNGFVASEFPSITVSSPSEDPDWFVQRASYSLDDQLSEIFGQNGVQASVTEMRLSDGTNVTSSYFGNEISDGMIARIRRDPLELFPSTIRPELVDTLRGLAYRIQSLPDPISTASPSPRYRAFDPIFGPIGSVPVTKGALELNPSEYTRLALSGAVCTVLVRTALNPLELVKTKIQIKNDDELLSFAKSRIKRSESPSADSVANFASDSMEASRLYETDDLSEGGTGVLRTMAVKTESTTAIEVGEKIGTPDLIKSSIELRGVGSLFQSADITFLASLVFGSFGFGATELFRRSFTLAFFSEEAGGKTGEEIILLAAAALACVVTSAAATPFEVLRVKSMGYVDSKGAKEVLDLYLSDIRGPIAPAFESSQYKLKDLLPLWGGFWPTLSRELPFAITKFLVFDIISNEVVALANGQLGEGAIPIQVGVGAAGLTISAFAGALAGIAGAFVSHPADLILTLTSTGKDVDWKDVVKNLLAKEGGVFNLFIGLPARATFFFLVIGLQFFLYDYVKNIFQVGSDDLSLVLDVFYAVRQGLVDMASYSSLKK
jgi:hypothetical protein